MNSASLAVVLEFRQGELCTCIWWKSFWIPPYKFVYFTKSGLEHILLVHNFFCCNFLHNIKLWNFIVGINNENIIRKRCVTYQTFGAVDGIISIKTHLKGDFGFSGILDLDFYSLKKFDKRCQKVMGPFSALYLPKYKQYPQPKIIWWICDLIFDATILEQFSF